MTRFVGKLKKWRWIPELRFINQYHDEAVYIQAIAASIFTAKKMDKKIAKNQKIIFSYHGTPLQSLLDGDPYHCQCHKTSRLVAEKLKLKKENYLTCFQSRFGSSVWLQPYTDKTLQKLPQKKISEVFIICPGFTVDCLETLEEINTENREIFLKNGGKKYTYIPCLNDSTYQLKLFQFLVDKHTQNWVKQEEQTRNTQNSLYKGLLKKYSFYPTPLNNFNACQNPPRTLRYQSFSVCIFLIIPCRGYFVTVSCLFLSCFTQF